MNKLLPALVVLIGCGLPSEPQTEASKSLSQELSDDNGMSANGFSANGMSANGFSANGFSANGFSANGMSYIAADGAITAPSGSNSAFATWFNSNVAQNAAWMKYVVKCAVPRGGSVSYGGYTWYGSVGVAPGFVTGNPTVRDQEAMTACLMAHVNANGNSVVISLLSPSLGLTYDTGYNQPEGAFFGNIFAPTRTAYACSQRIAKPSSCPSVPGTTIEYGDISSYNPSGGTGRSCASTSGGCTGMLYVGTCSSRCTSFTPWGSCTYNGQVFSSPITSYQPPVSTTVICDTFRFKFT